MNSIGSGIGSLFGSTATDAGAAGADGALPAVGQGFDAAGDSVAANSPNAVNFGTSAPGVMSGASAAPSSSSGIGGYLSKQNPLNLALAGTTALSAGQALMPKKPVNIQQNAANVLGTNPSFSNPNLPQYSMQNTASPYQGNWYTYGESPQAPLYNAQPQLVPNQPAYAAKGGLMKGYAQGGQVRHYAPGGAVMPMPPQNPLAAAASQMPQGQPMPQRPMMPQQGAPTRKVNPLAMVAAHKLGVAIGKHIAKKRMMTPPGQVHGKGGGQDDAIPARLSQGEFVHSADVVSALGDGSSNEGAKKLTIMARNIRKHKTSKDGGFPPKAKKNPLAYIGGAS